MIKWLFLDYENGFSGENPKAYLVELNEAITLPILQALEMTQKGVLRRGGKWEELMMDGKIQYKLLSSGRKSDYFDNAYDKMYHLISGNY